MHIHIHASLRQHNTFGIAAQAMQLLLVDDVTDLLRWLPQHGGQPLFVLGGGSNIVLTQDVAATVLKVALMGKTVVANTEQAYIVQVGAGESWHGLVQWTLAQGMPGLENLALIPGTVGAAPVQNIGAYGAELKDYLLQLQYVDLRTAQVHELTNQQCQFAYRDSVFKNALAGQTLITQVTLAIPKVWRPNTGYADISKALVAADIDTQHATPQQIFDAVVAVRQAKLPDPAQIGNAGSFFKNPVIPAALLRELQTEYPSLVHYALPDGTFKLAAGWLIDACGWKGKTLGRAGVYEKQALVLVNRGGASGAEIMHLARAIEQTVMEKFGVRLQPEPVII